MDQKVLIAIIATGGAVFGSIMTSLFAPWIKWRVEKWREEVSEKRERTNNRRELVRSWRKMIADILEDVGSGVGSPQELLLRHTAFMSLEPHLSKEARRCVHGQQFEFKAGVSLPFPLQEIKDEINRIEKEWDLV